MAYAPSCYDVYAVDDGSGFSFMDMRYLGVKGDIAANR